MQMRKTLRHSRLFCSVFRNDLQNSVLCIFREHRRFFTMAAEETCRNDTSMEEATGSAERVENEAAHGSQSKNGSSAAVADVDYPSAEELVAKARAPVKQEYICSAPLRSADARDDGNGAPVKISAEKKSRRQLKRERKQEANQKICVAVAKAGDVQACPYKENCRFSHDLEAFLAKKLPDLPGECPFLHTQVSCPYGPSCCFAGTHPYENSSREASEKENINEMNVLSKEFQKLLWKNAVKFPKSDAQLEKLGVLNKGKQNTKSNVKKQTDTQNGLETSINSHALSGKETVEQEVTEQDEVPPPKRSKVTEDGQPIPVSAGSGQKKPEAGAPESIQLTNKDIEAISEIDKETRLNMREKKLIDFRNKLYLAPLTTVGNLPFRRLCKNLGADITCGEMAMCTNLLQGQASEWALLRRHSSEDIFGVQICAPYPDTVAHTVELIEKECTVDFIDINMGCPIDIVVNKGAGSCILTKPKKMYNMIKAAAGTMENTLTVKVRMGYFEGRNCIHSMISDIGKAGAAAITIHGRTRQQRYSKLPDWDYIHQCVNEAAEGIQVIGNGDIFAYTDWNDHMNSGSNLSSCMIGRGALIKPWIFTEIKEQRHWDISSSERLDLLKDYVRFGLQHWGSDKKGVETTRRFLLEWLSYLCRYIPVGLLDIVPQRINWRPPSYFGRNDLETLMASDSAADWVRISEMLLGPVPAGFTFTPKHKSNAYDRAENG